MTKKVRNNASEIITVLGGVCWIPIAVLKKESTTIILVNEVIIIRIEGASDRTVSRATIWTSRPVRVPSSSCPRSRESVWARAGDAIKEKTRIKRTIARKTFMASFRRKPESIGANEYFCLSLFMFFTNLLLGLVVYFINRRGAESAEKRNNRHCEKPQATKQSS